MTFILCRVPARRPDRPSKNITRNDNKHDIRQAGDACVEMGSSFMYAPARSPMLKRYRSCASMLISLETVLSLIDLQSFAGDAKAAARETPVFAVVDYRIVLFAASGRQTWRTPKKTILRKKITQEVLSTTRDEFQIVSNLMYISAEEFRS